MMGPLLPQPANADTKNSPPSAKAHFFILFPFILSLQSLYRMPDAPDHILRTMPEKRVTPSGSEMTNPKERFTTKSIYTSS